MNVQALPQMLNQAYEMFDSLNLSVTALVAIALVLTVVCLFAVREAASWFFKIDDIKKDVKQMRQSVIDMEAEVRLLQGLLTQNVKLATERAVVDLEVAKAQVAEPVQAATPKKDEKPARFSVTH